MLVTLEFATDLLELKEQNYLYTNPKYRKYVKLNNQGTAKFDITSYDKDNIRKQEEIDFCIDMINFAEFVIDIEGKDNFYKKISKDKRRSLRDGIRECRISLSLAELVKDTFDEWYPSYENYEEVEFDEEDPDDSKNFIPFEDRKPLTKRYLKKHYWNDKKTTLQIANELNVPEGWIEKEIRRLGMQKNKNGVKLRGKKGFTMTQEQKNKRKNQPHSQPVVRMCPKTFKVLSEYKSMTEAEQDGYKRRNISRAIKRGGLSDGYLWAKKGLEKGTVAVLKKSGDLEKKIKVSEYVAPSKDELKKLYIDDGLTAKVCANIFNCHRDTISRLAKKYDLKKREVA